MRDVTISRDLAIALRVLATHRLDAIVTDKSKRTDFWRQRWFGAITAIAELDAALAGDPSTRTGLIAELSRKHPFE